MPGTELLCYICYIISWWAILPAIYRICKRKSSSDYSKQTMLSEVAYNSVWLIYVIFNPTVELVICAIIDVILIIIHTFVVFKYYNK